MRVPPRPSAGESGPPRAGRGPAVDAEEGRGEAYARLLADVMDRARQSEEVRSERAVRDTRVRTVRGSVLAGVGVVFLAVAGWNLVLLRKPPAELPPEERALATGMTMFAVIQEIEAFRAKNGRLPSSLEELDLEDTGILYTVAGDRYRLDEKAREEPASYIDDQEPLSLLESMGVPVERPSAGGGGSP